MKTKIITIYIIIVCAIISCNDDVNQTNNLDSKPKDVTAPINMDTLKYVVDTFKSNNNVDEKKENQDTINIGGQIWMTKNLDIESFENGDNIPEAHNLMEWANAYYEKKPAWAYYDYNSAMRSRYGKYYNLWAVTDSRGLNVKGWHIPTRDEWKILNNFLGDNAAIKARSKEGWLNDLKSKGTNESGLNILASGRIHESSGPIWSNTNSDAFFWSSTKANDVGSTLWRIKIDGWMGGLMDGFSESFDGLSVRLIKNTNEQVENNNLPSPQVKYKDYSNLSIQSNSNNSIKIGKIEVMKSDIGVMNWYDAFKSCKKYGFGWRLPTREELKFMYINRNKIGGFYTATENSFYWTNTGGSYIATGVFHRSGADVLDFYDGTIVENAQPDANNFHTRLIRDANFQLSHNENGMQILNLGDFEVMSEDLGKFDNIQAHNELEKPKYYNWEIPTISELQILYEHKDKIGGFQNDYYWSSSETSGFTKILNFGDGTIKSVTNSSFKKNENIYRLRSTRTVIH